MHGAPQQKLVGGSTSSCWLRAWLCRVNALAQAQAQSLLPSVDTHFQRAPKVSFYWKIHLATMRLDQCQNGGVLFQSAFALRGAEMGLHQRPQLAPPGNICQEGVA